jgi:hypothetical protein
MNEKTLMTTPIPELVDQFAEACLVQGKSILYDELATYKKAYCRMDDLQKELRRRGQAARLALTKLYVHPNIQVRLQAAMFTLAVAPREARQVIEWIAQSGLMPQAADARGTLRDLDDGSYKPD